MSRSTAAVVGTGFMGGVHVEALRRVGVAVVGVLGSNANRSREAAARWDIPQVYQSLEQLLGDEGVQAVHIATPNGLHFPMARQALAAGKHVMCEKPLAMSTVESRELVQASRDRPHLAAAVNYNMRFYPLCLEARQRVRRGDLGDVFHITGDYVQDWLLWDTDYNWRVLAESGGPLRAVADIGTHWLDLIQFISGLHVEAVCADLQTVHPVRRRPHGEVETFQSQQRGTTATEPVEIGTEDSAGVMLRLRGGARGLLHVSQVTAGRKNCLRFEIAGAKQALSWNSERPNELWMGRREAANQTLLRDPALMSEGARWAAGYPGGHNEGYADSFKQSFRAFYDYIAAGASAAAATFPTFADGHREIRLCEAILASHRRRGWVPCLGEE